MGKKITLEQSHIRTLSTGKRHINLTKAERTSLAQLKLVERAVSMFLDLEQDRTWDQIAQELGITITQLKTLTRTPEFSKAYEEITVTLGHDPRLRAVSSALPNLLPVAYQQLKAILIGPATSDNVRLKAILEIFKLNHVGEEVTTDDPREMTNFLEQNGVKVEGDLVVALGIPDEFKAAFAKFLGGNRSDVVIDVIPHPETPVLEDHRGDSAESSATSDALESPFSVPVAPSE